MKPPTMMLAPLGIIATASSADTAFMIGLRRSQMGRLKNVAAGPNGDP
jgi:hypothetical protein